MEVKLRHSCRHLENQVIRYWWNVACWRRMTWQLRRWGQNWNWKIWRTENEKLLTGRAGMQVWDVTPIRAGSSSLLYCNRLDFIQLCTYHGHHSYLLEIHGPRLCWWMMPCYSVTALLSGRTSCQASMKLHIRWVWIPLGRKPRSRT